MLKSFKMLALMAVLGFILAMADRASAAVVFVGTGADWAAHDDGHGVGVVTDGDKDFTYIGDTLNPEATIAIGQVGLEYTLLVTFNGPVGVDGPYSATLDYTVEITDGLHRFTRVDIDSTASGSGTTMVEKTLDELSVTISSLNGGTGTTAASGTFLTVHDTFDVSVDSNLATAVNTFAQVAVPEPATLAMLLGFAGLGLITRMRRRVK